MLVHLVWSSSLDDILVTKAVDDKDIDPMDIKVIM